MLSDTQKCPVAVCPVAEMNHNNLSESNAPECSLACRSWPETPLRGPRSEFLSRTDGEQKIRDPKIENHTILKVFEFFKMELEILENSR